MRRRLKRHYDFTSHEGCAKNIDSLGEENFVIIEKEKNNLNNILKSFFIKINIIFLIFF